ncbi:MAG: ABC transporter permease [Candidatus Accumulibacter propinquus]|jgi:NitT/TauT family transport system permease protein
MSDYIALANQDLPAQPLSGALDGPPLAAPGWPGRALESVAVWVVLLLAWSVASVYLPLGDNPLLPSPLITARALWESLPELWAGTLSSLTILLPGFALATLLGIVTGLAVGTSLRLQRMFLPFAKVAGPVPPTVYIPYAIAILPTFRLSAIFVVFIGAFWPIFQNAVAGAHALEQRYRDNARILGLQGFEYQRRVVFPAALPHIFTGMAVGLAFSFTLLTVAELFGANAGLGRFVQYYADFADYPRMVAGILYTGLVTFLAMTLLDRVRRRSLFWLR